MKKIGIILIGILLLLSACQTDTKDKPIDREDEIEAIENEIKPTTEKVEEIESVDESKAKEKVKGPEYKGDTVYRLGRSMPIDGLFDYEDSLIAYNNGRPIDNMDDLELGQHTLEVYNRTPAVSSEVLHTEITIVSLEDDNYLDIKDDYKDFSFKTRHINELPSFVYESYLLIDWNGLMENWAKVIVDDRPIYIRVNTFSDPSLAIYYYSNYGDSTKKRYDLDGDGLLNLYTPNPKSHEVSFKSDDLYLYSTSPNERKTTLYHPNSGLILFLDYSMDEIIFNEDYSKFVIVSKLGYQYSSRATELLMAYYEINEEAISELKTFIKFAYEVKSLEWVGEDFDYTYVSSTRKELYHVDNTGIVLEESYKARLNMTSVKLSKAYEELEYLDDDLKDEVFEIYELNDYGFNHYGSITYSDIKQSILTNKISLKDGQLYYWFEILDSENETYYISREPKADEDFIFDDVNLYMPRKNTRLKDVKRVKGDLLDLNLLLIQNSFSGAWQAYSTLNYEKYDLASANQSILNYIDFSPNKLFAFLQDEDQSNYHLYGFMANGVEFIRMESSLKHQFINHRWISDKEIEIDVHFSDDHIEVMTLNFIDGAWYSDLELDTNLEDSIYDVKNGVGNLNLRSGPGTDFSVVGKATFEDVYRVYDLSYNSSDELWYKVGENQWFISDFAYPE